MMNSRLLRYGRWLLALAILFFLIKQLSDLLTTLDVAAVTLQPLWFIASFLLMILYFGLLGLPWFFLYQAGHDTSKLSFLSGWTFFQVSQFGRYLPGKVWQFVWMLSLAGRFRLAPTGTVFATCLQLAFQCCSGVIIGLAVLQHRKVLPFSLSRLANVEMSFKTGMIALSIVALCIGTVLRYRHRLQETSRTLIKQGAAMFSITRVLGFLAIYLLLWGVLGIAFFLFIKSLAPVDISQLLVVTGIYAVAWNIGFLSLVTPSGLGVREGVLSLLLTSLLSPVTATFVALLARLWTLGAQLLLGGVAFAFYWQRRKEKDQKEAP